MVFPSVESVRAIALHTTPGESTFAAYAGPASPKGGIAGFPRILAVFLHVNTYHDGMDRKKRRLVKIEVELPEVTILT